MKLIKQKNRYVQSSTAPRKSQALVLPVQQQPIGIDYGIFALACIHSIGTKNGRGLRKYLLQSVIQNFRAASGICKKRHFWGSFTHKYLKITLFLEERALFCQMFTRSSVQLADFFWIIPCYNRTDQSHWKMLTINCYCDYQVVSKY